MVALFDCLLSISVLLVSLVEHLVIVVNDLHAIHISGVGGSPVFAPYPIDM